MMMSILTTSVSLPSCWIITTALTTDAYHNEHRLGAIPSLTDLPAGDDNSTIDLNVFTWCGLGTKPRGLVWSNCLRQVGRGPCNLPALICAEMRSSTTSGFEHADGWLGVCSMSANPAGGGGGGCRGGLGCCGGGW